MEKTKYKANTSQVAYRRAYRLQFVFADGTLWREYLKYLDLMIVTTPAELEALNALDAVSEPPSRHVFRAYLALLSPLYSAR